MLIRTAAEGVEHVIRISCTLPVNRPCEWVLALPVLHFLRHDLRPFEFPDTADLASSQWWGLGNLIEDAKAFREALAETRLCIQML